MRETNEGAYYLSVVISTLCLICVHAADVSAAVLYSELYVKTMVSSTDHCSHIPAFILPEYVFLTVLWAAAIVYIYICICRSDLIACVIVK